MRFAVPAFSPQGFFTHVPPTAVQDELRRRFAPWGLPLWVRGDNGLPWGTWNAVPTALALWLLGLGVRVPWNDPRHPEQHPKVERSQGTGKRWAEPWTWQDAKDLQDHCDREDHVRRDLYPAVGGRSRRAAFPALEHSGRSCSRGWERRHWDLHRAVQHLAGYQAVRTVSTAGHVAVYDHAYYVGRQHVGRPVYVPLDPDAREWLFSDQEGRELRKHAAKHLTRARLLALKLNI